VIVMTSANRSSEPIAYDDNDAFQRLDGIAEVFLVGDRPIARRLEDSVVRDGPLGATILRRSRGYSPGAVAELPTDQPILAVGADLKSAITLVVDGQAFVSQFIGDLDDYLAFRAFRETIDDLLGMYQVSLADAIVVRDAHPQYRSSAYASSLGAADLRLVQHHRAHIASVLAERGEFERPVLGVSFDGTGYGDEETIWGGEFFHGSVRSGFQRVAHLREAALLGGDAAAGNPVQAAAGFLAQSGELPDLEAAPFHFPARYRESLQLLAKETRVFRTTSAGRLFDAAAALLGFTRAMTFEGQAAIWLEHLAQQVDSVEPYACPFYAGELDYRPLLRCVVQDRAQGVEPARIARAFHAGLAAGIRRVVVEARRTHAFDAVVLSGGVFQNLLLLSDVIGELSGESLEVWTNHAVPPNDGGISLGQATIAAFPSARAA
jgi:hydrogenase maturation protein HypF